MQYGDGIESSMKLEHIQMFCVSLWMGPISEIWNIQFPDHNDTNVRKLLTKYFVSTGKTL